MYTSTKYPLTPAKNFQKNTAKDNVQKVTLLLLISLSKRFELVNIHVYRPVFFK